MAVDEVLARRLPAAAAEPYGLTKAGRALHKHGSRPDSVFPPPSGAPAELNRRAQAIVEQILDDPRSVIERRNTRQHGLTLDVWAPDGRGLRYSEGEQLIGFLEPKER